MGQAKRKARHAVSVPRVRDRSPSRDAQGVEERKVEEILEWTAPEDTGDPVRGIGNALLVSGVFWTLLAAGIFYLS